MKDRWWGGDEVGVEKGWVRGRGRVTKLTLTLTVVALLETSPNRWIVTMRDGRKTRLDADQAYLHCSFPVFYKKRK